MKIREAGLILALAFFLPMATNAQPPEPRLEEDDDDPPPAVIDNGEVDIEIEKTHAFPKDEKEKSLIEETLNDPAKDLKRKCRSLGGIGAAIC